MTPRAGSIAPDAFLDFVRRPDGTPVDPEVVTQFNCLQQTGDFCPSSSNGPAAMSSSSSSPTTSSSSTSLTTMSAHTTPSQAAADVLFALMGTQDQDLGSLGTLSPSHRH